MAHTTHIIVLFIRMVFSDQYRNLLFCHAISCSFSYKILGIHRFRKMSALQLHTERTQMKYVERKAHWAPLIHLLRPSISYMRHSIHKFTLYCCSLRCWWSIKERVTRAVLHPNVGLIYSEVFESPLFQLKIRVT